MIGARSTGRRFRPRSKTSWDGVRRQRRKRRPQPCATLPPVVPLIHAYRFIARRETYPEAISTIRLRELRGRGEGGVGLPAPPSPRALNRPALNRLRPFSWRPCV